VCVSCGISGPCLCSCVKGLFCFFVYKQCICKCVSINLYHMYAKMLTVHYLFLYLVWKSCLINVGVVNYSLMLSTICLIWQNI